MRTVLVLLALTGGADARRRLQGAAMVGGRPPKAVVTALCSISDVFAHMCERPNLSSCSLACRPRPQPRTNAHVPGTAP